MEQYSKEVMDHFTNPRNVGEIKDADGVGQVGNIKCGDIMYVYIKIEKRPLHGPLEGEQEEYIKDIKFKTLGCAAAIASSSMLTELAKGKSLEDAKLISRDDINEALGILPQQKYHCSILSAEGLQKAIADYEGKNKK
jgi:nitrogen fixation NifU-like protein